MLRNRLQKGSGKVTPFIVTSCLPTRLSMFGGSKRDSAEEEDCKVLHHDLGLVCRKAKVSDQKSSSAWAVARVEQDP
ncbi:hypothetical protein BAUCODRAFT_333319 [Baudoinia panamericana UAMH 10762]|uniref:Uncharacterized protein n=1 Tax=Baudoinia panamericana (strain UAMH 10762) TaxID=717646 RepID=M2MIE2_BAUPA|nr:uncharacterized protein BAUCODRAFT_333319 [Baudoinia panamericana UAMH 10762]EMC91033.1 hypothetical protein BAUCODRAFT_333319 [Baudoinia panamericana UAMH 10762]